MPAVHIVKPHLLFGRINNRLGDACQKRSPCYCLWAYLRRHENYLKCCESGGTDSLSGLHSDFGDVREDNFHKWWTNGQRGMQLFTEQWLRAGRPPCLHALLKEHNA